MQRPERHSTNTPSARIHLFQSSAQVQECSVHSQQAALTEAQHQPPPRSQNTCGSTSTVMRHAQSTSSTGRSTAPVAATQPEHMRIHKQTGWQPAGCTSCRLQSCPQYTQYSDEQGWFLSTADRKQSSRLRAIQAPQLTAQQRTRSAALHCMQVFRHVHSV